MNRSIDLGLMRVLTTVVAVVICLAAGTRLQAQSTPTEVVTTRAGQLRGFRDAARSIDVFRGVHYGQSTAGERRFRPALPVAPWDGIKDATRFGDVCPQTGTGGRGNDESDEPTTMSEDCLVLNVWTPGVTGARPVMVWLHGRGYAQGAGSEEWYDGTNMAARGDIVVVTINHRLNVFGYLHLADVGGADFATSGNVGLLDVRLLGGLEGIDRGARLGQRYR
jgi:para-nitrobenzyl esterase